MPFFNPQNLNFLYLRLSIIQLRTILYASVVCKLAILTFNFLTSKQHQTHFIEIIL